MTTLNQNNNPLCLYWNVLYWNGPCHDPNNPLWVWEEKRQPLILYWDVLYWNNAYARKEVFKVPLTGVDA